MPLSSSVSLTHSFLQSLSYFISC